MYIAVLLTLKTLEIMNEFKNFTDLENELKNTIELKWNLPTNKTNLFVDEYNRPFVKELNKPKMICNLNRTSLIDNGFHNSSVRNNTK